MKMKVQVKQVADLLEEDAEFCLDVLAHLAERKRLSTSIEFHFARMHSGSIEHCNVAPFLRRLADELDAQYPDETSETTD
jgi:hypothetical protein